MASTRVYLLLKYLPGKFYAEVLTHRPHDDALGRVPFAIDIGVLFALR
jgi:hypothetical protein